MGHLVVGPPEHGVTRCARELALAAGDAAAPDLLHVHYTDRLFGPTAETSAAAFTELARGLDRPLVVTLHDVPPDDGSVLQQRRARAYAAVVDAAVAVVVSSHHEAARLRAFADVAPHVVPLPVQPLPPGPVPPPDGQVVVLGFVYPGKGHAEALRALPAGVGLTALGRASDGHDDLLAELAALGPLTVTGYVPDDELPSRLRAASVPLAPHRHVSASGSIGSWLAAGRRPLVPDVAYTREVASRCPGALWLYDDLAPALAAAVADPSLTWLAPGTPTGPTMAETVAAHRVVWATAAS
ncbi:Glycosyltransferase involved in cell wall bisynthesis [Klenkia marina]|uniref:Glycosyltransferase involved in cell wall bisynthesis n=1 Tax=Klenkia marina TaxID=1960309 RepID=A0A1G4XXB6_9ACTN|nr:glycosyltransferase [Klenkia marina]SCX45857.1 Glycosyltransferase involved in cell wall bisynthesis [Klenkia marina]